MAEGDCAGRRIVLSERYEEEKAIESRITARAMSSRRERSIIAQGKRSVALGNRQKIP
jgi:hypothetical protein